MSLTSYRAAPPRGGGVVVWWCVVGGCRRTARSRACVAACASVGGWLGGPGGDLRPRVLRRSTIGGEGFHGRVREGIGCLPPRHDPRARQANLCPVACAVLCVC